MSKLLMMSDDRVVELGSLTLPPELHKAVKSGYVVDLRIRIIDVPKDQITAIPIVNFVDPGAGPKEVASLSALLQGGDRVAYGNLGLVEMYQRGGLNDFDKKAGS
jgi:hypothetical protein